ncbi:ribbon-helix-helix domain-containing protein [Pseudomonas sp. NPDC089534]|uniref:ribbon-helix-helix domain-containing protein n=1 Tax=Pseudomonas sp. NPDC089534 TaxID=3364468 RepID=UPI0037F2BCBC
MADGDRRCDRTVGPRGKLKVDPFEDGLDMALIRPLSRSVRLNGFSTCLRLEQVYWNVLGGMAEDNGCSVSALLSHMDREVLLRHGGVRNFSALVRVVCVMQGLKTPAGAAPPPC